MSNVGFKTASVLEWVKSNDCKAIGTAWMNYTSVMVLSLVKGMDRKEILEACFEGGKASDDFNKGYSRAKRAYAAIAAAEEYDALRGKGFEDARKEVVTLIERHMLELGVKGKNAYDAVCSYRTRAELDKALADKAEREAEKQKEGERLDGDTDEGETTENPPVNPVKPASRPEKAMDALNGATKDELMLVMSRIADTLSADDLEFLANEFAAMANNVRGVQLKLAA